MDERLKCTGCGGKATVLAMGSPYPIRPIDHTLADAPECPALASPCGPSKGAELDGRP